MEGGLSDRALKILRTVLHEKVQKGVDAGYTSTIAPYR